MRRYISQLYSKVPWLSWKGFENCAKPRDPCTNPQGFAPAELFENVFEVIFAFDLDCTQNPGLYSQAWVL